MNTAVGVGYPGILRLEQECGIDINYIHDQRMQLRTRSGIRLVMTGIKRALRKMCRQTISIPFVSVCYSCKSQTCVFHMWLSGTEFSLGSEDTAGGDRVWERSRICSCEKM
jgi:hypothetical protein